MSAALSRRAAIGALATVPAALTPAALAASIPAPSDRSAWDRAYYEYRLLRLRMDAYYALGPFEWANEAFVLAQIMKATEPEKFEDAAKKLDAQEAEQLRYYKPVDAVALALVKMPAPDLDAVTVKLQLHKDHLEGTDNDRITWACIEDDLTRLAA